MPTYKNETAEAIKFKGELVAAGAEIRMPEYARNQNGLTLVTHIGKEVTGKLLSAAAPGETAIEIYPYFRITILNTSGDKVKILPNGNSASENYWVVTDGDKMEIINSPRYWHSIATAGDGAEEVYIWGQTE